MRKVIEHIDDRKWRTLEYFRMLDRTSKGQLEKKSVTFDILVRSFHINPFLFIIYSYIYVHIRNRVYNSKMTM